MVYESNANVVYYDGIQLYKEEFGHSYVYDSDCYNHPLSLHIA